MKPINVVIQIEKATNLYDSGLVRHSDPYVLVSYKSADPRQADCGSALPRRHGTSLGKTKVIKNNLNPVWKDEKFSFSVPSLATIVKFVVMDKDRVTRDDYLGTTHLRLWDHVFEDNSPEEVWLHLHPTKKFAKQPAQGSLKINITVNNLPSKVYEEVRLMGIPDEDDSSQLDQLLMEYIREEFPDFPTPDSFVGRPSSSSTSASTSSSSSSSSGATRRRPPMLRLAGLGDSQIMEGAPAATETSARQEGKSVSFVRLPLIAHRLSRVPSKTAGGQDSWSMKPVVIGASSQAEPESSQSAEGDAEEVSEGRTNPWETPKKPPKKSTYDWSNWGQTIFVKPRRQWHPKSLQEIKDAVADARANNVKLRCVAHAHSWSPIFSDNGNDLMFLHQLNKVKKHLSGPPSRWTITAQGGATNGGLAAMLIKNSLFLPTNVISTEFLVGGVLSTGSHGSGWNDGLVLDSVVQLKIVDGLGELRTFNRYTDDTWTVEHPDWKYVVLNLGLFGIVYKITYRVERQLQRALTKDWYVTLDRFWNTDLHERVITGEHYTELFWFPFNDTMWVKTWGFTNQHVKWRPFHTMWITFAQWAQSRIGHYVGPLIATSASKLTPAFCKSSMKLLQWEFMGPEDKPKEDVLAVPDAIHWRKFLDAMPVWNCEVGVDLPDDPAKPGKVDVSAARDLWMFVVELTNDIASGKVKIPGLDNKYPNNITLEARFIKNTCAFLSNAYGNQHTMFIEWVTNVWTPGWKEYSNHIMQECIKRYPNSCRSHWAKYQQDMPDWIAYNREKHGARFDEFRQVRTNLGVDPHNTFTTSWLEAMFDLH